MWLMVRTTRRARLGGDELDAVLNHLINRAGNPTLMSEAVKAILCDQFADCGEQQCKQRLAAALAVQKARNVPISKECSIA
jgi:hypothetical protein